METKYVIALMLLFLAVLGGVVLTSISHRIRLLAFFLMMALAVISERLDVNFFSRYYYRGSTRGVEISFVDVLAVSVLASSVLFPRPGQKRWRWPAGLGLMLVLFFYAVATTLVAEPKIFAVFELSKMLRGLIFFMAAALFVRDERDLKWVVLALCCAGCMEGLFVVKQRWLDGMDRVAGTLDHPNSLSMYLCLIAPVFVAAINAPFARWLKWLSGIALSIAVVAILLTVSRAGVPTFALVVLGAGVACISWRVTLKKIAITAAVLVGMAGIGFKFGHGLTERFRESTLKEEYVQDNVIDSRGYFLRLAVLIMEDRPWGIGLNNWSYWVSRRYGTQLNTPYDHYDDIPPDFDHDAGDLDMNFAAPAHNLCALTVGELGLPGLAIFLLMWLRWFQMGFQFIWRRKRTVVGLLGVGLFFGMAGVFLQSVTEWIFRQTPIYLTFHALLAVLASLYLMRRKERKLRASPAHGGDAAPQFAEMAIPS